MISTRCKGCGQRMELHDAFAGGYCRCSTCGRLRIVGAGRVDRQRAEPLDLLARVARSRNRN